MTTFTNSEVLELSNAILSTMDRLNKALVECNGIPEVHEVISRKQEELQKLNNKVLSLYQED